MDTQHPSNQLVVENLALVGYHVNAMLARVPSYVSRSDLSSAGALALVRAARGYDESTGVPFARYAALRIRGALVDELRGMDWVSRGARQRARRMTTVSDELTSTLGRTPTREELASALGVGVDDVDAARGSAEVRVLSLEGFDGAVSIADSVVDAGMTPEESVLADEKMRHLRAGVASLPERLRYIVEELFFRDRPVVELADELGVTQSRISQLRTEALALIKDGMNANLDPELVPVADRPGGVAERRRREYFAKVAARAAASAQVSTAGSIPTQRTAAHEQYATASLDATTYAAPASAAG